MPDDLLAADAPLSSYTLPNSNGGPVDPIHRMMAIALVLELLGTLLALSIVRTLHLY